MGVSNGDFVKYPRTPHLFGSRGTSDDKHLGSAESEQFIADDSLVVEEKLDGTNVGIHFNDSGDLILQSRGHLITDGMHPQYDLFKQWATCKRPVLESMLGGDYIMFGEWMYAEHSVSYRQLPHYFFEFDVWQKSKQRFLDLNTRLRMLDGTGVETVPVVHRGRLDQKRLQELIGPSAFDSRFENPLTNQTDNVMEGLYLRTENEGCVTGRAKIVRPEFVEKIKQSTHWQHREMVANQLQTIKVDGPVVPFRLGVKHCGSKPTRLLPSDPGVRAAALSVSFCLNWNPWPGENNEQAEPITCGVLR